MLEAEADALVRYHHIRAIGQCPHHDDFSIFGASHEPPLRNVSSRYHDTFQRFVVMPLQSLSPAEADIKLMVGFAPRRDGRECSFAAAERWSRHQKMSNEICCDMASPIFAMPR